MDFGRQRVNKIRVGNMAANAGFVRGNKRKPRRRLRQGKMDERLVYDEELAHRVVLIANLSPNLPDANKEEVRG